MLHIIRHFVTITKHRHQVIRLCFKAGIPWRGLIHDLSKYSASEFWVGAKYWQGDRSPNDIERREKGYSAAWLHHKGRNRHHFEYWVDYAAGVRGQQGVKMPAVFLVEMMCDRIAACKIYCGSAYTDSAALEYFERSKSHYTMHPQTLEQLGMLLRILSEHGENAVFAYIRRELLHKRVPARMLRETR